MPIYALDGMEPRFDDRATNFIAPDAVIIGNVHIGRNVSIWFGAVLRGDNEPIVIGEGSNVQEQVVMHTDPGMPLTVGRGCTVGHLAMLHGCTIEDYSLVGMSATVLNGARIGTGSLVGAGALVTEGKQFEPGMLIVGSPAKAARALAEGDIERLKGSSQHYVHNGHRFRDGLRRID